ncbi:allantoate deiminase [Sediminihabitans luteus]|uniref:Allantoate deiminase n=1 Tax=Sediminihabitans luteus TaxID=1138585 RepID=A0A2M9CYD6_9CELL|nr:allantoate amidohydrolase [Sediminihabitans luteus]PJJ76954.1 allantoate deiminase [Sediminihabitans luteus]GII99595.1 Zn-dependent hydrolase [Sediminihabitans luteus]
MTGTHAPAAGPASTGPASADAHDAARRALARCDELATVTAVPGRTDRFYLTPEHARANTLVAGWMREAGLRTAQDAAGNVWGRTGTPDVPLLVLGSHLDTVPDAGRYDGPLGVVVAVEVARRLAPRAAELPFEIGVVGFGDEEGARFGATLLGSRAVAGTWDPAWFDLPDAAGTTMREAFVAFGLDPAAVGDAALDPGTTVGYLEAHIEQGVRLEDADRPLGVVSSIAAARRFEMAVLGEARHAGGTPYDRRRDAALGASHAVLEIERIARAAGAIATVGRLQAYPGGVNVIPGRVELSLDLRAETDALRDHVWDLIHDVLLARCVRLGLRLVVEETHRAPAVPCAPGPSAAVARAVTSVAGDVAPLTLFSPAGHDAMSMAALTDVGMLFVRCGDGVSHHPDESVREDDVALAVDALEQAVLELAGLAGTA